MNEYQTTAEAGTLRVVPFELPQNFLEQLGYRGSDMLVGLYGTADSGVIIYDQSHLWTRCPNVRPWLDVIHDRRIAHWLFEYYVDVGQDAARLLTHHLLIMRTANLAFVAPASLAMRLVQRQGKQPK